MLLRLLKYNTSAGYLLIPLIAAVAWLPSLYTPSYQNMIFDHVPMPLYEILAGYLPHDTIQSKILGFVLLVIIGFYLIRLNNKYMFLPERTLLPAFLFIFISSSFSPLHRLHPAGVAMLFFLPAIDKLLASYKTERLSYNYFESSFLIGLGSLFYFNLIWFIAIVWAALLILRPVIWREWAFSLLGAAMPWFFFIATDLLMNGTVDGSMGLVHANLSTHDPFSLFGLPEKIFFSILLLMIVVASRKITYSMPLMKVLSRKIFKLFFWIYAISVVAYFFANTGNAELIVPATVPVAFLLSHYLITTRSRFRANAFLWFVLAGLQILAWFPWK